MLRAKGREKGGSEEGKLKEKLVGENHFSFIIASFFLEAI